MYKSQYYRKNKLTPPMFYGLRLKQPKYNANIL